MQIRQTLDGSTATLHLEGRFDFHSHRDFRAAVDAVMQAPATRDIVISFSKVDYLDSSALGMLLLLREKADSLGNRVTLSNMHGMVKQVLDVANFNKLLDMKG